MNRISIAAGIFKTHAYNAGFACILRPSRKAEILDVSTRAFSRVMLVLKKEKLENWSFKKGMQESNQFQKKTLVLAIAA